MRWITSWEFCLIAVGGTPPHGDGTHSLTALIPPKPKCQKKNKNLPFWGLLYLPGRGGGISNHCQHEVRGAELVLPRGCGGSNCCFPPQARWPLWNLLERCLSRRFHRSHLTWGRFGVEERAVDVKTHCRRMKGFSLFQGIEAWHFPQKISCHDRQWPRLCKDLGIKKSRTEVMMVCSDWSAGKKHLLKMPSWQLKPNLRKDSAMRRELPLLVAYVFSIKMSLSSPTPSSYSAGRNTKLAL